ncbi:MAG: OST-HTH/LOTUS domain-containing protein [Pseudomonadota bacterium]
MAKPITNQIRDSAIALLREHPEGLRTGELKRHIEKVHPDFHPKTINGVVWVLAETCPDQVEKPERGLFRHKAT